MSKFKIRKIDSCEARAIQDRLKANDGYCPCSIVKNADTKCMCKAFREQNEPGTCHCGLYIKEEEN